MLTHMHHKIPRHMGGKDDPENLVELTVEDHAIAHKVLYGLHGKEEDRIAWRMLSGQITARQANSAAISASLTGRKLTQEHKLNISKSTTGISKSKAHSDAISEGKKGIYTNKDWIENNLKGKTHIAVCPHCGTGGNRLVM